MVSGLVGVLPRNPELWGCEEDVIVKAGLASYNDIPQTHFPPSPRRPTRWRSCGQVYVDGKKSQIVYGYFPKSDIC